MPQLRLILEGAEAQLARAGVASAKLDARLLLQHVAQIDHATIIAEPKLRIDAETTDRFWQLVWRRVLREPVARILGEREFYGRPFRVSGAVLDPRPDTETLVDAVFSFPKPKRILDLGTGSGILAITLLAEFPNAKAVAVDVSPEALMVAQDNAETLNVQTRVKFLQGSWFAPVEGRFDLIVSNPPYIPGAEISGLQMEVQNFDPHLALDGGPDGLAPYRTIAAKAPDFMTPKAHVLVEVGAGQMLDVHDIFLATGYRAAGRWRDLGGHIRALAFNMP